MSIGVPHIVVVDPAVRSPEVDTYNHMCGLAKLPLTYHMPALYGFHSFPSDESLIRGVVILGSAASVYDNLPWQRPLETWLRPLCEKGLPVLGLCYGHQMIAHMFGGKVSYVHPDKRKLTGIRQVHINLPELKCSGQRSLVVTHNEMVTTLSADFTVTSSSAEIEVEGLKHSKLPIFGFQAHIEATVDFLRERGMIEPHALRALPQSHSILRSFFELAS